jgi:hypothetical protein
LTSPGQYRFRRRKRRKFENFIDGHLTDTGTRKDVEITKEYTNDVCQTVKRIHNGMNERAVDAEIAKTIGPVGGGISHG